MARRTDQGNGVVRIKLPRYLIARRFKGADAYYWMPPKKTLLKYDLLPRRLAQSDGTLATAVREAERFNAELDAIRAGENALTPENTEGTLPWLYKQFQGSTKYTRIADRTQGFYDDNFKIIRAWSEEADHPDVATLTRELCLGFYEILCQPDPVTEDVRLTRALHVMKTLRRVLKHGEDVGRVRINPATKMELVTPSPRMQVWRDDQMATFIAAAIKAQRSSLALGVRIAGELGPRRGDIIRLPPTAYSAGVFTFRPRKNSRIKDGRVGKIVQVNALPTLRAEMDAPPRPAGNTLSTTILVNERTGMPYTEDAFSRDFREIADSCPGLVWTDGTPLLFMDLRRTAVINLARAGCTIPEIAAITGHSKETIHEILETYLPTDSVVAGNAIAKLAAYREKGTKLDQS